MTDLPARLDRLADLAARLDACLQDDRAWEPEELVALMEEIDRYFAALVKVARAVVEESVQMCLLCVTDLPDHTPDCPLAALDVQLAKGDQDG